MIQNNNRFIFETFLVHSGTTVGIKYLNSVSSTLKTIYKLDTELKLVWGTAYIIPGMP